MRIYTRRQFLGLTAGVSAAAIVAAACGDDDDGGDSASPTGEVPSTPAATTPTVEAGTDNGAAAVRWYGQSMFLLTAPDGTELLLDPFNDIGYEVPPPLAVAAATITHEHPDHSNGSLAAAPAVVYRGLTADGWAEIDETVGGVRIRTVGTYHDEQQGAERGRNAVFVFETAGLRIAHLGDLGHQLDGAQVAALGGPVDVVMIPTGGTFTLDPAGATELVTALAPKVVFPMHYGTEVNGFRLARIEEFTAGKTVQTVGATNIRLAADSLPAQTTVMVLDYA
jgi:L-ascorbate metabolism protein UlaG (beta-lactamase superfamily)